MSAVSGCASQPSSPGAGATAEVRPLRQKELEAARLAEGEAGRFGVGLHDTPSDMKASVTTFTPEVCRPAMSVLLHGWGEGATAFTRLNLSDPADSVVVRSVALTSYPAGEAKRVMAAVEESLQDCSSVSYEPLPGSVIHAKLSRGKALSAGDESVTVKMSFVEEGFDSHVAYGLVRTGDVLAWFNFSLTFGSTLPKEKKAALIPHLEESLVDRQVKKVETALQAAASSY
ncbi:hypothetical protein ACFVOK_36185 [Streptomyces sp. NPDC057798]|uniref:hypothetical protein n=1 Tax=Streptomyces sp. NPDC057798 TaxID=3346252 RepID=UPI0036846760